MREKIIKLFLLQKTWKFFFFHFAKIEQSIYSADMYTPWNILILPFEEISFRVIRMIVESFYWKFLWFNCNEMGIFWAKEFLTVEGSCG